MLDAQGPGENKSQQQGADVVPVPTGANTPGPMAMTAAGMGTYPQGRTQQSQTGNLWRPTDWTGAEVCRMGVGGHGYGRGWLLDWAGVQPELALGGWVLSGWLEKLTISY